MFILRNLLIVHKWESLLFFGVYLFIYLYNRQFVVIYYKLIFRVTSGICFIFLRLLTILSIRLVYVG